MTNKTEGQRPDEESSFAAPSTPGWKILKIAIEEAIGPDATIETHLFLIKNLEVRIGELIPIEHRKDIAQLLIDLMALVDDECFPQLVTDFLLAQLGVNQIRQILDGTELELTKCKSKHCGLWHIVSKAVKAEIDKRAKSPNKDRLNTNIGYENFMPRTGHG